MRSQLNQRSFLLLLYPCARVENEQRSVREENATSRLRRTRGTHGDDSSRVGKPNKASRAPFIVFMEHVLENANERKRNQRPWLTFNSGKNANRKEKATRVFDNRYNNY